MIVSPFSCEHITVADTVVNQSLIINRTISTSVIFVTKASISNTTTVVAAATATRCSQKSNKNREDEKLPHISGISQKKNKDQEPKKKCDTKTKTTKTNKQKQTKNKQKKNKN
mmetsp:Transcript_14802/g.20690  ORF Transcript_14802/g.20690 Transcript_14802/m.20690 type:complete len:113 (-) Transcript_14802:696-1034(-)